MDRWTGGRGWTGGPVDRYRRAQFTAHRRRPRTRGRDGSSHVPRSVCVRRKRRRSSQCVSARELARQRGSPSRRAADDRHPGRRGVVRRRGRERVLDNFQRSATSTRSSSRRSRTGAASADGSRAGSALPDHGKQEYDDNFHGGNFATPHPQYYRNTSIAPEKAPDHPNYDVIADVLPAANKRGMKVICWFEDVIGANVPGFDQAREVTLTGRAVDIRVLTQSKHAQLLARDGRGLSPLLRRRRPHVGQRAAGPARQRARRESRRRRRRRRHRVLLPVLHRRGEEARASTSTALARVICSWRAFVERRRATGGSPPTARSSRSGGCSRSIPRSWHGSASGTTRSNDTYRDMYHLAQVHRSDEGNRLAHLAQQLVLAVLPRRAGLRGVREVF